MTTPRTNSCVRVDEAERRPAWLARSISSLSELRRYDVADQQGRGDDDVQAGLRPSVT